MTEAQTSKFNKLVKDLTEESFNIKNSAIKGLGKMKGDQARAKLLEVTKIKDMDVRIRLEALQGLINKKRDAALIDHIQELFRDEAQDSKLRRACMTFFARNAKSDYINLFISGLQEKNQFIRIWAVRGLINLKSVESNEALIYALGDENEEIRKNVRSHLDFYCEKDMIKGLIRGFESQKANKFVRLGTLAILTKFTDSKEVLNAIVKALNDGNDRVVRVAIRSLGKLASLEAFEPLYKLYSESEKSRVSIENAYFKIGKENLNILLVKSIEQLANEDPNVVQLMKNTINNFSPDSLLMMAELRAAFNEDVKKAIDTLF